VNGGKFDVVTFRSRREDPRPVSGVNVRDTRIKDDGAYATAEFRGSVWTKCLSARRGSSTPPFLIRFCLGDHLRRALSLSPAPGTWGAAQLPLAQRVIRARGAREPLDLQEGQRRSFRTPTIRQKEALRLVARMCCEANTTQEPSRPARQPRTRPTGRPRRNPRRGSPWFRRRRLIRARKPRSPVATAPARYQATTRSPRRRCLP
jgi:hypothetical protein